MKKVRKLIATVLSLVTLWAKHGTVRLVLRHEAPRKSRGKSSNAILKHPTPEVKLSAYLFRTHFWSHF